MVIQHLAKVILMKQLLIKDNQYKSKSYFSEIKDVVDCIADKTLAELEKEGVFVFPSSVRESEDLTNDQMILQRYVCFWKCNGIFRSRKSETCH